MSMGITTPGEQRPLSSLQPWKNNPREITSEDFERLKKQLQKLGQYKPLIIAKDGTVLGGNMRLRAFKELGIEQVWVSVVDAPDDATKLQYALSDNDRSGYYLEEKLAVLLKQEDIDIELFKVDISETVSAQAIEEFYSPAALPTPSPSSTTSSIEKREKDEYNKDEELEKYQQRAIRQIVLLYPLEQHEQLQKDLDTLGKQFGTATASETVAQLVTNALEQ